jgi:hypothetical protein
MGGAFPPNTDVAMTATATLEVPIEHEALLRRTLALAEELHQLALSAPDGAVFDACEAAVVRGGREVQQRLLTEAVARRIEAAEKRGRRSDSVPAVGPKRIAGRRRDNS